ncbi:metal ABC transporter permease [Sporosarcina sp. resist]|nr:metal ABC transporter permease [Sporosarcina sp. resist]
MFGSIITINVQQVWVLLGLTAIIVLLYFLFRKPISRGH